MNVMPESQLEERQVENRLKLGLLSYPVLQAADVLVHRYELHAPLDLAE